MLRLQWFGRQNVHQFINEVYYGTRMVSTSNGSNPNNESLFGSKTECKPTSRPFGKVFVGTGAVVLFGTRQGEAQSLELPFAEFHGAGGPWHYSSILKKCLGAERRAHTFIDWTTTKPYTLDVVSILSLDALCKNIRHGLFLKRIGAALAQPWSRSIPEDQVGRPRFSRQAGGDFCFLQEHILFHVCFFPRIFHFDD